MADCPKSKIPPFDPDSLPSDAKWVPLLDDPDQLEYWSVRSTFDAAKVTYDNAVALAQALLDKVGTDFQELKDKWSRARSERDEAITAAKEAQGALAELVKGLEPGAAVHPDAAKRQIAELQTAVEAYGKLLHNISAKEKALDAALDVLKKASQQQPGAFDPEKAEINPDRLELAKAQFRVARDTARKPYTRSWDVLLHKRAVLYSHLDDHVPDSELEAQSA